MAGRLISDDLFHPAEDLRVTDAISRMTPWHQIVVEDPENLSGPSTKAFLAPLMRKANTAWVYSRGLDGAYFGLRGFEGQMLPASEFLAKASQAVQYDWAFFYLFESVPNLNLDEMDNEFIIEIADATARLIDDQYFCVYSRNENIKDFLLLVHPEAEHKRCAFAELNIPY